MRSSSTWRRWRKSRLPAGRTLFEQGELPDYLYLIRKGKLRVAVVATVSRALVRANVSVKWPCSRAPVAPPVSIRWNLVSFCAGQSVTFWVFDAFPEIGRALLKSLVRRLANTGKTPPSAARPRDDHRHGLGQRRSAAVVAKQHRRPSRWQRSNPEDKSLERAMAVSVSRYDLVPQRRRSLSR